MFCALETNSNSIQCDMCKHFYHLRCCSVKESDVPTALSVIELLGWSCVACRSELRSELDKLRSEIATMRSSMSANRDRDQYPPLPVAPLNDDIPDNTAGERNVVERSVRYSDMVKVVNKTLTDNARRKRNVVISGLYECGDSNQEDEIRAVTELCDLVHFNARANVKFVKRIGKSIADKPRRLLVGLNSDTAASELLTRARSLRDVDDDYICASVFINKDLSPEEATEAYKRRVARRRAAADGQRAVGSDDSRPTVSVRQGDSTRPSSTALTFWSSTRSRVNHNLIVCTPDLHTTTAAAAPTALPAHLDPNARDFLQIGGAPLGASTAPDSNSVAANS